MNDEIKLAAKKYASMYIDDYYNQHKESFEAGASYATEKCQEEIKRLKEDLSTCMTTVCGYIDCTVNYGQVIETLKSIKQRHNLGASK